MLEGYLRIQVNSANDAYPIENAMIRVYKDEDQVIVFESFHISDTNGLTPYIALYAPSIELSLDETNREKTYESYHVEIRCDGYETLEIVNVQIFATIYTNLPVNLIPTLSRSSSRSVDYVPDHQLLTNYDVNEDQISPPLSRILSVVTIPKTVTVHLGRPDSSAENLNVDFIYYVKNCASSEIYPSWEPQALRANIYCIISLMLNRIYTEWYPSRGYAFDITNSTAFDQAFVKNRNIFDNISEIVDEIFNEYIQKGSFEEPYYAEYCDGSIADCPGLKQWGTQSLALQGYGYFQILQYYYGNTISIVTTNNIQEIQSSYPGVALRVGSSGIDVTTIQKQLNAIALNYPAITPILPVDGIFGTQTENAVKVFQRTFSLTQDGIIGKATWYKISFVYVAVRKLAELGSFGVQNDFLNGEYPGTVLRQGDKSVEVQYLQYMLISISKFDKDIKTISTIDGSFGSQTYQSVISFQSKYNLTADGIVGVTTWNKIYSVFTNYEGNILPDTNVDAYPGYLIRFGSNGTQVFKIQQALNVVGSIYSSIPILIEDSNFGSNTLRAVQTFQNIVGLDADGIVGQLTWVALFTLASEIKAGDAPSLGLPPYPGTLLRVGSSGSDVLFIQQRLQNISMYYKSIPYIVADGIFGNATRSAVIAFQNLLGLSADGIVGQITWYKINEIYTQLTT